jgi:hypothetical protein
MNGIFTKTFGGNNAFHEARAFVAQQAADLLQIRKDGSIAAADKAIAKAEGDRRVKETAAVEWCVTVTVDAGDFKGLVERSQAGETLFEQQR